MTKHKSKDKGNLPPAVKRELTEVERGRIEKHRQQQPDTTDFLKPLEEGGYTFALDESLSPSCAIDDLSARLVESTGLSPDNGSQLLLSIAKALKRRNERPEVTAARANRIRLLMRDFAPKDAIESQLCCQIIVCTEKALELMGDAGRQHAVEWSREFSSFSNKMFVRAQAATEALIKYRRGGQQRVTVEHLHVSEGGRAIVGNVSHQPGGGGNSEPFQSTP
jgi:hypothetical protein